MKLLVFNGTLGIAAMKPWLFGIWRGKTLLGHGYFDRLSTSFTEFTEKNEKKIRAIRFARVQKRGNARKARRNSYAPIHPK
jgi:hypothetical protein